MHMKTIGKIIREKREINGLSRKQLARKIKITEGYLGHIERDGNVRISERLEHEFKRTIGLNGFHSLIVKANKLTKKWRSEYLKSKK